MMDIESLFLEICKYIEEKSEYFDIFIKCDTRYEGWFQTEILKYIVDNLSEIKIKSVGKNLQNWGKADIVFEYQNREYIIELKAGVIGKNRGYNLYLITNAGAGKDFSRMGKEIYQNAWAIICLTPCKGSDNKEFISKVTQAQETYNVKKWKEFKFYTPEEKPVTITLWGKKIAK
ncbi:hypothetical protein ES703_62599 [subsurface metagenome]